MCVCVCVCVVLKDTNCLCGALEYLVPNTVASIYRSVVFKIYSF